MAQLTGRLGPLFSAEHRDATIDALTARVQVTGLVDVHRPQAAAKRVADAEKQLDNLLTSLEDGLVDAVLLAPRIKAKQQEVADLRAATADRAAATPAVTRADVERLIDAFAEHADEVFGPDAAPQEVNDFLHAIGLHVRIDGVARMAYAAIDMSPTSVNPPASDLRRGVNERVRGGT